MAGIIIWSYPDDRVKVVFCDVGQGDGALIIKGNFQMLIDTGPENKKMVGCLGRYLPFWDKQIEAAVITHDDGDHSGGLKEVKRYYNVQKIYSGNLVKNDVIKYGLISFEVLNPDRNWGNDNDNSVVGILRYADPPTVSQSGGQVSILFLGDVTSNVEQKLVWRKELADKIDIVKISHHGSAEATSTELLETTKPDEAIISVGRDNIFGHPTKEVLDKLHSAGVTVKRTDELGDIVIMYE